MPRNLYLPEKYRVFLGQGKAALCTCWIDPEELVKDYPEVLENFSIIGSLYSKEGVSIMLRNLALNPDINRVFLWKRSPLSMTKYGSVGWKNAKKLWSSLKKGDYSVAGSIMHKEIDPETARKVASNVKLVEFSGEAPGELGKEPAYKEVYMEPASFPETRRDSGQSFPSEYVGWTVRGGSVQEVWLKVIDRIMRYGKEKPTEYGNRQRELQGITWVIEGQETDKKIECPESTLQKIGLIKESIKEYQKSLLDPELPEGVVYTYGQRLKKFSGSIDQLQSIIARLKNDPSTRRAVACLFSPREDNRKTSPPCLNLIQVLSKGDRLNLFAVFRSHDLFKAAIPNAYGLEGLLERICEGTGKKPGKIMITSISAHIYEEDWEDAENLLKCNLWGRIVSDFEETQHMDSRGFVRIYTLNKEIFLEIHSKKGSFFEVSGKTARDVGIKLARLDLLSRPDHYVDTTIELVKAEMAIRSNKEYSQDNAFFWDKDKSLN